MKNRNMTMSHVINVAIIQDIHPLNHPKYSTEELAILMIEKGIEMKDTTRPTSPQRRGHSLKNKLQNNV
jgi:hypothetical protein